MVGNRLDEGRKEEATLGNIQEGKILIPQVSQIRINRE